MLPGCRSALVNAEARTLQSSSMMRKCVMIRSSELTYAHYLEVIDQTPSAILVLMQSNMSAEQTQVGYRQISERASCVKKFGFKLNTVHLWSKICSFFANKVCFF